MHKKYLLSIKSCMLIFTQFRTLLLESTNPYPLAQMVKIYTQFQSSKHMPFGIPHTVFWGG